MVNAMKLADNDELNIEKNKTSDQWPNDINSKKSKR